MLAFWEWSSGKQLFAVCILVLLIVLAIWGWDNRFVPYYMERTVNFALTLIGVTSAFMIAVVQVGMAMQDRSLQRREKTIALNARFNENAELHAAIHRVAGALVLRMGAPNMPANNGLVGQEDDLRIITTWFEDMEVQIRNGVIDGDMAGEYFYAHMLRVIDALKPYFAEIRTRFRNKTVFAHLEKQFDAWQRKLGNG